MSNSPIIELFENKDMVTVCAPMVRYSKLPFRQLVRSYGCDLCFTPMIIADSLYNRTKQGKTNFQLIRSIEDTPLIVQFAASNSYELTSASELVASYSDGVDLNCGCPQRWAMAEGYGAKLLSNPQIIKEMVQEVRNRIRDNFTISVKIRLLDKIRDTISLCQSLEAAGISFITIHGRKIKQRSSGPVDIEGLREITRSLQIPVIANGDVVSLDAARNLHLQTGSKGVMAARGLLTNPALFSGFEKTPAECIQRWISITQSSQTHFKYVHHHLVFMLEKLLPKKERVKFNVMKTKEEVLIFLSEFYNISYDKEALERTCQVHYIEEPTTDGKYFKELIQADQEDYLEGSFHIF